MRNRAGQLLVFVTMVGCGPATVLTPPPPVIAKPKPTAPPKEPAPESPARWSLSPSEVWQSTARLDLGTEGVLYVGGRERWVQPLGAAATSAGQLTPEDIVAVARAKDGKSFYFVGASGTIHFAATPLGALSGKKAPPQLVRSATAGKDAIVLIGENGDLLRSTDGGSTFGKTPLPKVDGALSEVMMGPKGEGLLRYTPQRLFYTLDDGVSWTPIAGGGIATRSLTRSVTDQIAVVSSPFGAVFQPSPPGWKMTTGGIQHVPMLAKPKDEPELVAGKASTKRTVVSGHRVYEVRESKGQDAQGAQGATIGWTFGVGELGGPLKRTPLTFSSCKSYELAAYGDAVELGCMRFVGEVLSAEVPGGKGKKGWVLELHRSTDAGATFHDDGQVDVFEHGIGKPFALGPEGFLLIGMRCKNTYYTAGNCSSSRVRPAGASKVVELEGTPLRYLAFGFDPKQREAYALVASPDASETLLYQWPLDAGVGQRLVVLDTKSSTRDASIAVDGASVVIARESEWPQRWIMHRSTDGGATFDATPLPETIVELDLHGARGLSRDRLGALRETADFGKTWSDVASPADTAMLQCSEFGCSVARGFRIGWDLAPYATAPAKTPPARTPKWATPIRCQLEGKWVSAGYGDLPTLYGVDPVAGVRYASTRRTDDARIFAVITRSTEKGLVTSEQPLLGPAPTSADLRSQTIALVQPLGIVAARYTYLRKKGFGSFNKVDADFGWYDFGTSKVHKASFKKVAVWRVQHDPQYSVVPAAAFPLDGETLAIASGGLYFAPPAYSDDSTLFFARDSGLVDKLPNPTCGGCAFTIVGKSLVGYDLEGASGFRDGVFSMRFRDVAKKEWIGRDWALWSAVTNDDARASLWPIEIGGHAAVNVTWSGSARMPAASFGVQLADGDDPSTVVPLATQAAIGDPPRSCDKTALSAARLPTSYLRGTRHPVTVSGEGDALVLATDDAVLRGMYDDACLSTYLATQPEKPETPTFNPSPPTALFKKMNPTPLAAGAPAEIHAAVISPHDLGHAVLFRQDRSAWPPKLSTRAMTCAFEAGPLPVPLQGVAGFYD